MSALCAKSRRRTSPSRSSWLITTVTIGLRNALAKVRIVGVVEPAIGIAAPIHLMVTEPGGKAIVIEFTAGAVKIHDAPLGVITNSPNYDWHTTNLRNYVNLSAVALPMKKIEDMNFAPLGGGSGMIGLLGDFTPPSRFVRAVAFAKSARPTATTSIAGASPAAMAARPWASARRSTRSTDRGAPGSGRPGQR